MSVRLVRLMTAVFAEIVQSGLVSVVTRPLT